MKKEDKKVNYRPLLAKKLSKCLQTAIELYSVNFQKVYYLAFARVYENEGLSDRAELLKKVASCFDSPFPAEEFHEEYARELNEKCNLGYVSVARAAKFVFSIYEEALCDMEQGLLTGDLTKAELYMVSSFFRKLTAPLRNPNIEVKEGHTKCWYDEELRASFQKDLNAQIKYIKENCQTTIDIFSTPDEEFEEEQEKEVE